VRIKGDRARDVIYSGLCWRDGFLYVLLRQQQRVLKVAPESGRVLAEYSYGRMERDREVAYRTWLPMGLMEGIAVTEDSIWLVTDNNGLGRALDSGDRRPVLFRCRRPDLGSFCEKTR
jgi:glutamine cyclotransferase